MELANILYTSSADGQYKYDDIGGYDDTDKRNDKGTKSILEENLRRKAV